MEPETTTTNTGPDEAAKATSPPASEPSEERDLGRELAEVHQRRLSRFGVKPVEEAAEEKAVAAPPAPEAEKPKEAVARQEPRPLTPPKRGYLDRSERRSAHLAALEERIAKLSELVEKALPKPEVTPTEPGTDEHAQKLVRDALREELGQDTIAFLRQSREKAEQEAETARQYAAAQQRIAAWSEAMTESEARYRQQTPEAAAGYYERLQEFVEITVNHWMELGDTRERAYWTTMNALGGLSQEAISRNIEPAEYIDWTLKRSRHLLGMEDGNGHRSTSTQVATVAGTPAAPAPDPEAERREKQRVANAEARERREAAKVASSPQGTVAVPREPSPVSRVRQQANGHGARALVTAAMKTAKATGTTSAKELLRQLREELSG